MIASIKHMCVYIYVQLSMEMVSIVSIVKWSAKVTEWCCIQPMETVLSTTRELENQPNCHKVKQKISNVIFADMYNVKHTHQTFSKGVPVMILFLFPGDLVQLGDSTVFRFNNPHEADKLRRRHSVS